MSPARLIILGILFYLLYRLLMGAKPKNRATSKRRNQVPEPTRDVLVEDPVCHVYIPKNQAIVLRQGEKSYHFCSEKCKATYIENKGEQE